MCKSHEGDDEGKPTHYCFIVLGICTAPQNSKFQHMGLIFCVIGAWLSIWSKEFHVIGIDEELQKKKKKRRREEDNEGRGKGKKDEKMLHPRKGFITSTQN